MTPQPLPPNAIAANFLDTAQLDIGYCIELITEFDMAQITVVDATHPNNANTLAYEVRRRRPQTTVFYRKWRDTLHDERMVDDIPTAIEWIRYFQPQLEAGCVCAVYNEALTNPFTKSIDRSLEILELCAPHGWATVHAKWPTGNPGGFNGEHLLPKTHPNYRPDEYSLCLPLFKAAAAMNAAVLRVNKPPVVWFAPHAYFDEGGSTDGQTNRYREFYRVLDGEQIPRRLIPIACGEFALALHGSSAVGFKGEIDDALYADLYTAVWESDMKDNGIIAHLFSVGDQQRANNVPGKWFTFSTFRRPKFWNRLKEKADAGTFRLRTWYGGEYATMPNMLPRPLNVGAPIRTVTTTKGTYINLRIDPDVNARDIGNVLAGEPIDIFPLSYTPDPNPKNSYTWYYVERVGNVPSMDYANGYVAYSKALVDQLVADHQQPPVDPPADAVVEWSYTVKYRGTVAQRTESKEAWAGLSQFLQATGQAAPVVVSIEEESPTT